MSGGSYVTSSQKSSGISGLAFAGLMEAVLEKNVPIRFTASGCSMAPFIRDGDLITVSPVHVRLRPGDVVSFVNPYCNKLMVHRILHVSRQGYLIKGDNNSVPDGLIPAAGIIGRVVRVEHMGRRVRFGLETGGILIAWLSQRCWLTPLVRGIRHSIKPFKGKSYLP